MSWSGNSFFGPPQAAEPPAPDQRTLARDLYSQDRLEEALAAQQAAMQAGVPTLDDLLFLGLIHHAAQRIGDAIGVLREATRRFPGEASVHENLGVLLLAAGDAAGAAQAAHAALKLGSTSANLYDCLAEAQERLGRPDLAVLAGRQALEMKDQRFGGGPILAPIPHARPAPFSPDLPGANLIVYSLWGQEPRYIVPLIENARILPHLFPSWTMRVYHDHTADPQALTELANRGAQLRAMTVPANQPRHRALLWRFEPVSDPAVQRFLIRDADSLLTVKERVAVDAWLASGRYFHAMRDWYTHTDLILAGMWGGVGGILPPVGTLLQACTNWRFETNHIDQDLLTETVWPSVRASILIHDSLFAPCLGSVPFPPFGALPPGHHVGMNSFVYFNRPR